ncbi:MAG: aminoglycoside phosphotransferase family protein [Trueperaceae bacterium]
MPQDLSDFPPIVTAVLSEISRRHDADSATPVQTGGICNAIYFLGDDLVLRVPRNDPDFVAALEREVIAVPAARTAGVRTPALVTFDDSRSLIAVPYAVYERVPGQPLERLGLLPDAAPLALEELGRDLARLHDGVDRNDGTEIDAVFVALDPRDAADELAERGSFTRMEANWLDQMLGRLAPAVEAPFEKRLCHGDTQGTNIMVAPASATYLALIDWGNATWDDPAKDFAGLPLGAIPFVLAGYRSVSRLENAEARILWWQLQNALYLLHRPPLPELPKRAWAERPMAQLLEITRFLITPQGRKWRDLVT